MMSKWFPRGIIILYLDRGRENIVYAFVPKRRFYRTCIAYTASLRESSLIALLWPTKGISVLVKAPVFSFFKQPWSYEFIVFCPPTTHVLVSSFDTMLVEMLKTGKRWSNLYGLPFAILFLLFRFVRTTLTYRTMNLRVKCVESL